jgi:hypothetical protein
MSSSPLIHLRASAHRGRFVVLAAAALGTLGVASVASAGRGDGPVAASTPAAGTLVAATASALDSSTADRRPRRADLVVSFLSALPIGVNAGASIALRLEVKNAGRRNARSSQTTYWLSVDRRRDAGDISLPDGLGRRTTTALRPGRVWKTRGRVVTPAATPPGSYYLLVCVDATRRVREHSERNCWVSAARTSLRLAPAAPSPPPPPAPPTGGPPASPLPPPPAPLP